MAPRFLIAKYVPDLRRMEPRNIGVIVWTESGVDARFAGEDSERKLQKLPGGLRFNSKDSYRQWVTYWRLQIVKPSLEMGRGEIVSSYDPKFLDAIRETARGNYILVDGGYLLDSVKASELPSLTDYLFTQLVSLDEGRELIQKEHERVRRGAVHVMKRSGLSDRKDLQKKWPAPCLVHGVQKSYDFDFAIGDTGRPSMLLHHVILGHEKTFDSFVLNLGGFFEQYPKFDRQRVGTFVYVNGTAGERQIQDNLRILRRLSTPINVADEAEAESIVRQIAPATP